MDYPRISFTEWNLGKFPDSVEFQSWKVNFRTETCLRAADPQITVLWIKEVEIAKINRRTCDIEVDYTANRFHRLRYAWCCDCVCLEKTSRQAYVHYRKRLRVEEQRAQKDDRFLRGRQIACMIYEYFRATGAYEAGQGRSDLFKISTSAGIMLYYLRVKYPQI